MTSPAGGQAGSFDELLTLQVVALQLHPPVESPHRSCKP